MFEIRVEPIAINDTVYMQWINGQFTPLFKDEAKRFCEILCAAVQTYQKWFFELFGYVRRCDSGTQNFSNHGSMAADPVPRFSG